MFTSRRSVVLVAALLLLSPLAAGAGKITCSTTVGRGTLGFISTTEPGDPPVFTFLDEGEGGDPDVCLSNPGICTVAPCVVSDNKEACGEADVGACYDFLLFNCGGGPAIQELDYVASGPCPLMKK